MMALLLRCSLLASLVLITACLPAQRVGPGARLGVDDAARAQLDAARAKAKAGDHEQAAALFEDLAHRYPRSEEADEALYGAGLAWEAAGQRLKARAAYERLLADYPRSDKAPQVHERLAALGAGGSLEEARRAYEALPEGERYRAAVAFAEQAEEAADSGEAFHWRGEALRVAPVGERERALRELEGLVERLSALDLEALAKREPEDSPAAPLLAHRLAQVHHERRDWDALEDSLSDFLRRWPEHPLAPPARELLEKIARRGEVYPDRIGVVLPLSGTHKVYGQQILDGIELALQGAGFHLIVRDSEGEAAIAEAETERLFYEDHVMAVFGGVLHGEAQAVAGKADELGLPLFTFSPATGLAQASEWIFRDMLTNEEVVEAVVDFAMEKQGLDRFAILHPEMPYGEELRDLFARVVAEHGGVVEPIGSYAADATTFSEPIKKMVGRDSPENHPDYHRRLGEIRAQNLDARRRRNAIEKMRQSLSPQVEFDAIFVPDQWRKVALVAPALAAEDVVTTWCDQREVDRVRRTTGQPVRPVMLLGVNLWNHPELPTRAGKYVNCAVFVDGFFAGSARPETRAFVDSFQRWKERAPTLLEAYGAEAATLLRHVVAREAPTSRRQLRNALSAANELPGPMGPITVREGGEVVHPLYLLVVDRGVIKEVEALGSDDESP